MRKKGELYGAHSRTRPSILVSSRNLLRCRCVRSQQLAEKYRALIGGLPTSRRKIIDELTKMRDRASRYA